MMEPRPHYVLCVACGVWHRAWSRSGNTFGATTLWSDGFVTSIMLPAPEAVVARCASCRVFFWLDGAPRHSPSDRHDPPPIALVVIDAGAARLKVIHALRSATGIAVAEARAIVDERRAIDTSLYPDTSASEMRRALEAAGARVEERGPKADPQPRTPSTTHDIESPYESLYLDALDAGVADTIDRERTLRTLTWWLGSDPFRGTGRAWVDLEARDARVRQNVERLAEIVDLDRPRDHLTKIECARQLGRFDEALSLVTKDLPVEDQRAAGVLWALARRGDRSLATIWTRG